MLVVGIDVGERAKGQDLVALDHDRQLIESFGGLSIDEVAAHVERLAPSVVCVDSPSGWASAGRSRKAERDLRALGISAFATPQDPGDHPFYRWMRTGFEIYEALHVSFPLYRGGHVEGCCAEVFPAATAFLLEGALRPADESKVRFRRRVLREHGVDVDGLPNIDRVDAALAALTGLASLAGEASWLGDPAEGALLLPTPLPSRRLEVRRPTAMAQPPVDLLARTPPRRRDCDPMRCGCRRGTDHERRH